MTDDPKSVADAPTPEDVIARTVMCELDCCLGEPPDGTDVMDAKRVMDALAAAGFEVVPAGTADRLAALSDHVLYNELVRRDALRCDYELGAVKNPDNSGEWVACEVAPEVVSEAVIVRAIEWAGGVTDLMAALQASVEAARADRTPTPDSSDPASPPPRHETANGEPAS